MNIGKGLNMVNWNLDYRYKINKGNDLYVSSYSENPKDLIVPTVENPELLRYTAIYKYYPSQNKSLVHEDEHDIWNDLPMINLRRKVKKSPYQPQSNYLYRDIHRTLNMVNRMYEKVYENNSKNYPIEKHKMPSVRINLYDRPYTVWEDTTLFKSFTAVSVTTMKHLGCAYLGSNEITITTRSMKNLNRYKAENMILHELGHGVLGLKHCNKRGKRQCLIMARYLNPRNATPNQLRTRFRRLIYDKYYKSQIQRLKRELK